MRSPLHITPSLDVTLGASKVRLSPEQSLALAQKLIVYGSRELVNSTIEQEQQLQRRPLATSRGAKR